MPPTWWSTLFLVPMSLSCLRTWSWDKVGPCELRALHPDQQVETESRSLEWTLETSKLPPKTHHLEQSHSSFNNPRLPNPFPTVPLSRDKVNQNLCHPFWLLSSDHVSSSSNLPATTYTEGKKKKRNNEKSYRPSYNRQTKWIKYCF